MIERKSSDRPLRLFRVISENCYGLFECFEVHQKDPCQPPFGFKKGISGSYGTIRFQ